MPHAPCPFSSVCLSKGWTERKEKEKKTYILHAHLIVPGNASSAMEWKDKWCNSCNEHRFFSLPAPSPGTLSLSRARNRAPVFWVFFRLKNPSLQFFQKIESCVISPNQIPFSLRVWMNVRRFMPPLAFARITNEWQPILPPLPLHFSIFPCSAPESPWK